MKLWQGRISQESEAMDAFNASIAFDSALWQEDITGSIAHAKMLGACGIITAAQSDNIVSGLEGIFAEIEAGTLKIDLGAEDIHTFVEGELTRRIGEDGKRLHTARSRNDQVALDFRMYVRRKIDEIREGLLSFLELLCELSEEHQDTLMPGYTHLQRAQPQSLGQHLLAYAQMLLRDRDRFLDARCRVNVLPLGAGALAGTSYPIDRGMVAEILGFDTVSENALDTVSDRDFALEFLFCSSTLMMHLSRFSEEITLWNSSEFGFVELSDAYATGSSMMPQKKNPDAAELCRGKTGRVYGDLFSLLTVLKGLPLSYNKDLQEDKEGVFDAADTVLACLEIFSGMISTMKVKKDTMAKAVTRGFLNATDLADYLTRHGVPFRDAYKLVGELVAKAAETGVALEDLDLESMHPAISSDVYEVIDPDYARRARRSYGGAGDVPRQIEELKKRLKNEKLSTL